MTRPAYRLLILLPKRNPPTNTQPRSVSIFIELSLLMRSNVHKWWWNIINATKTRDLTRQQATINAQEDKQAKARPYVATYRNRTAQRVSDMPASLARTQTGLHAHALLLCLSPGRPRSSARRRRRPGPPPYCLPPRAADRVGHHPGRRPAMRANNGWMRRRARAYPRPPATGDRS